MLETDIPKSPEGRPYYQLRQSLKQAPSLPRAWAELFTTFTLDVLTEIDDSMRHDDTFWLEHILAKARTILSTILLHHDRRSGLENSMLAKFSGGNCGGGRRTLLHEPPSTTVATNSTSAALRQMEFPVEILHHILGYVSFKPALAACCSVNQTWSAVARPLLWQNVRLDMPQTALKFFCGRSSSRRYQNRLSWTGWDVTRHINQLVLSFTSDSCYSLFTDCLSELTSLKRLRMYNVQSMRPLEPLLAGRWERCISLTFLEVTFNIPQRELPPLNYDRNVAKRFFSRLVQMQWRVEKSLNGSWQIIKDSAHEDLQVAVLPAKMPLDAIRRFIINCSSSLRAISLVDLDLTDDILVLLAVTCPKLIAVQLAFNNRLTPSAISMFVERCGDRLELLDIDGCLMDRSMFYSIIKHCSSLVSLRMMHHVVDVAPYTIEDCVLMLQHGGRKLTHLCLMFHRNHPTEKLMDAIAHNCPSLQQLMIFGPEWTNAGGMEEE
ncbi:hypothetical protein HK102_002852, partial [Quaeritorhiza haematococci]